MAGVLTETVSAYFTISGSSTVFVLDDPVRGVLDGATYTLAGDVAVPLDGVRSVQITRGRERALDEITVGVANVVANNFLRTYDPNYAAGTYYGNIVPGKRVTISTNGVTRFDGLIDDWNFDYPIAGDSTASFDVVDALAQLGSAEFDEWTTSAGQLVGARLTSILDRTEVAFPGGLRDLDVGTSTLQADLVSWGSNVLNYAQLVVKADLGQLFASKDGVLTFYGRNRSVTGVGAPILADDGSGIGFSEIAVDFGTELLFNRVSVDATGFTKQTVTDAASFAKYGKWYSLSIAELPLETQQQALDLANYLLNLYKDPTPRISSVTVLLHAQSSADQATLLNLEIGSVVRVVYTPNGIAPPIDKFCLIEGVSETIGNLYHSLTFRLSNLADGFAGNPFILDSASLGVLDTAGVLAF